MDPQARDLVPNWDLGVLSLKNDRNRTLKDLKRVNQVLMVGGGEEEVIFADFGQIVRHTDSNGLCGGVSNLRRHARSVFSRIQIDFATTSVMPSSNREENWRPKRGDI